MGKLFVESGQQIECEYKMIEAALERKIPPDSTMYDHTSSGTVPSSPPVAASAAALSPNAAIPDTLPAIVPDWAEDPALARLPDASAGDSCENVKVGSRNHGIRRGIYRLVVDHLDHLGAAAPPRVVE